MNTKRPYEDLSEVERGALRALHERISVSGSGPTTLARRVTGNPKLRPSDDTAQVFIHLVMEGWIVHEKDRKENIAIYKVSEDFAALQLA